MLVVQLRTSGESPLFVTSMYRGYRDADTRHTVRLTRSSSQQLRSGRRHGLDDWRPDSSCGTRADVEQHRFIRSTRTCSDGASPSPESKEPSARGGRPPARWSNAFPTSLRQPGAIARQTRFPSLIAPGCRRRGSRTSSNESVSLSMKECGVSPLVSYQGC